MTCLVNGLLGRWKSHAGGRITDGGFTRGHQIEWSHEMCSFPAPQQNYGCHTPAPRAASPAPPLTTWGAFHPLHSITVRSFQLDRTPAERRSYAIQLSTTLTRPLLTLTLPFPHPHTSARMAASTYTAFSTCRAFRHLHSRLHARRLIATFAALVVRRPVRTARTAENTVVR
jgi:hypothetical protein